MMRTIYIMLIAALVAPALSALTVTRQQADKVAEEVYQKGDSFADAVLKTNPKYIAWKKSELSQLEKEGVKYGAWRASKQADGNQLFTCTVESGKDLQVGATSSVPGNTQVLLNGELVFENTRNHPVWESYVLNLKKGKNTLEFKVVKYDRNFRWNDRTIYPYADPMRHLRDFFWRDYREHMNMLGGEPAFLSLRTTAAYWILK